MSKIREKESLECGRMHIWALKTQKLPGPLSGPWTPAANCSLRSRNSASLRRQLSASAPGPPPPWPKSWIRTWAVKGFSRICPTLYIRGGGVRTLMTVQQKFTKTRDFSIHFCQFAENFTENSLIHQWPWRVRTYTIFPYSCPSLHFLRTITPSSPPPPPNFGNNDVRWY